MRDTIFVSCRTGDGGWAADLIYNELIGPFDEDNVFLDSLSIGFSDHFEPVLADALDRSAVVLVLIGRHWLVDQSNRKRIDDPDDYVRLEIHRALALGVPVIPILLDATPLPPPSRLPPPLRELSFTKPLRMRKWETLRDLHFLVEVLSYTLDRPVAGGAVRPYSATALAAFALANVVALGVGLTLATDLRYSVDAWLIGAGGALLSMILFALGLFDVRPGSWLARRRLRAHERSLLPGLKKHLSGLRAQARRLRWRRRPARWMYVGCALLIAAAGLAVATAPAARCIGEAGRRLSVVLGGPVVTGAGSTGASGSARTAGRSCPSPSRPGGTGP